MALTKHEEGSVRELWAISFPLMLSSFSFLAMIFVDRLFLAHYSPEAMSAAVTSGTAAWSFIGSGLILAAMAEVFVAQYNGAGIKARLGEPVWQMIWFSVASTVIFLPIGFWGGELIFDGSPLRDLEEEFFRWLLYFGPTFPLGGALAAFYVGRGKTFLITTLAFVANIVNVILDWLFIFGVEGWIPSMGVKGAAIATCLGNVVQIVVLLVLFLNKHHRSTYGTGRCHLVLTEMWKCLKVGIPQGMLFFVESVGWTLFYMMITNLGTEHIFVASIVQTIVILFFFFAEGIGRGASAIAGNFIGARNIPLVYKMFVSGLKMHLGFFVIAAIFLVLYPEPFMELFMGSSGQLLGIEAGDSQMLESSMVIYYLKVCMQINVFFLLFEGVRWLISGILAAAGDTMFLLVTGTLSVVLFLLIPTYFVTLQGDGGVIGATAVTIVYSFLICTVFLWRFFRAKWQKINLIIS